MRPTDARKRVYKRWPQLVNANSTAQPQYRAYDRCALALYFRDGTQGWSRLIIPLATVPTAPSVPTVVLPIELQLVCIVKELFHVLHRAKARITECRPRRGSIEVETIAFVAERYVFTTEVSHLLVRVLDMVGRRTNVRIEEGQTGADRCLGRARRRVADARELHLARRYLLLLVLLVEAGLLADRNVNHF
uniref:Uncharacterized protein n=1 Tax=Anopheles culicifacies TaxID=139723 RepID=A0A182M315_9DIPT